MILSVKIQNDSFKLISDEFLCEKNSFKLLSEAPIPTMTGGGYDSRSFKTIAIN